MKNQLPDTPWHLGMPKMKEGDQRRLNKWCIHYDSSICKEPRSGCYLLKCNGSSHCKFYAESLRASEKLIRDNMTQEELDAERRRQYVASLAPRILALVASSDERRYIPVRSLQKCYVCNSDLLTHDRHHKQCALCHIQYIDKDSPISVNKTYRGHPVFVMGQPKPELPQITPVKKACRYCGPFGKCRNKNAPLFQKRCDVRSCATYQKEHAPAVQEFTVIRKIPIDQIMTQGMAPPRVDKLNQAIDIIRRNGKPLKPVHVKLTQGKYQLTDGYCTYLAARYCGLTEVPVILER